MNVSVLMAVYNREDTITFAIESIINQLKNGDELIISDDGSSDSTPIICDEFQQKYPNIIKVYHHENLGVEKNMIFLFEKANNEIIIINDSDDVSISCRVEKVKEIFKNNPNIDIIYHNAYVVGDNGKDILEQDFFKAFKQNKNKISCLTRTTFFGAMMCFRKSFIKENIKYLNNKYVAAWDRTLGLVGLKKNTIMFVDEKLINYRRWNGNISKKNKSSLLFKIKTRINWVKLYLLIKKNIRY